VSVRAICFTIPRNGFGFSTGRAPEGSTKPGVTDWMHDEIQTTAGKKPDEPLTFADLWTAEGASVDDCRENASLRAINLQMITTSLTHGRPYRLPFEDRRFFFKKAELEDYFPEAIVAHMVRHAEPDEGNPDLYCFTDTAQMPIVVAARMSLSFPILFTLVPFYVHDTSVTPVKLDRAWFIDGGLSSNFPVSLFDSPFPRWPTFGIDLCSPDDRHRINQTDESENIWMPERNEDGRSPNFHRLLDKKNVPQIGLYISAILDSIRNWRDNTQMSTPGFLDRVVHIVLDEKEGGLNLNMDPKKIGHLSERGEAAGEKLLSRFGANANHDMNWNNHRWLRYLIGMTLLQNAMQNMEEALSDTTYAALLARTDNNPKTGYWKKGFNPKAYQDLTKEFQKLAAMSASPDFDAVCPKPKPELRITPGGV